MICKKCVERMLHREIVLNVKESLIIFVILLISCERDSPGQNAYLCCVALQKTPVAIYTGYISD